MEDSSSSEIRQTATVEFSAAPLDNSVKMSFQSLEGFSKVDPITLSLSLSPESDSKANSEDTVVENQGSFSVVVVSEQGAPTPTTTTVEQPEVPKAPAAVKGPLSLLPSNTLQPQATIVNAAPGLQIVTRKRSAAAGSVSASMAGPVGDKTALLNTNIQGQSASVTNVADKKTPAIEHPPKKKKKYTPKPKKSAAVANANTTANDTAILPSVPAPPALPKVSQSKSKKSSSSSKSKSKKQSPIAVNSVSTTGTCNPIPKSQEFPVPKQSKSSSSKSKKIQQIPVSHLFPGSENYLCGISAGQNEDAFSKPPPLQPMPKLTRMPSRSDPDEPEAFQLVKIKQELPDWDECQNEVCYEPSVEKISGSGSTSRKKKSKGRNGNIYIGVFNRIEWMKLQDAFGFTTVNNFGTFVLETMRRVHGDIQFWCDLATSSGVYQDLANYEWRNGFPHAVNQDGKTIAPELDSNLTEEKKADVVELGKKLWEQRLQHLKLQQQLRFGDGEGVVQTIPEEVEVDDEEDEVEDTAGLDNYLENMDKLGCGQYSPPGIILNSDGLPVNGMDIKLTEEQINSIWSEQLTNAQTLERFGEIFNFINSIDQEERGLVQKQLLGIEPSASPTGQLDSDADGNDGMVEIEAAALL